MRRVRIAFWAALALSWVVAVAYMWDAMTTIPSAERLEASRVVGIPTPRTFLAATILIHAVRQGGRARWDACRRFARSPPVIHSIHRGA